VSRIKKFALKAFHLLTIVSLFGLLNMPSTVAQTRLEKRKSKEVKKRVKERKSADSVWQKDIKITDTSAARIIGKIEDINTALNNYNDVIDNGYDSSDIVEDLPGYERRIKFYQVNFASTNNNLSLSRLSYIQGTLEDMAEDMVIWKKSLLAYYTELVGMNTQVHAILHDSSVENISSDSTLFLLYSRQLNQLKNRLKGTDTLMKKNLLKIDLLQSKVANDYMEVIALQKQLKGLVKSYRKKAFTNEGGYLWQGPSIDTTTRTFGQIIQRSYLRTNRILGSYLPNNWDKYIFGIPIFLLFFIWVYLNILKVQRNNPDFLSTLKYVQLFPLLASLVVMLIIVPYLDMQHPPVIYIQLLHFLLIVVLSILMVMKWPRKLFYFWLVFVLLFIFFVAKSALINSTYYLRVVTFFLTLASAVFGWQFIKQIKQYPTIFPPYFKFISGIYILLNLLAAACNLYGRATLAHILETTAIVNHMEVIGLIVFIQIFLDAVNLQLEADKKSTRFTAYLDYQNVELRLRRLLTVLAGIFWFINLAQNLNIFDAVYDWVTDFMDTERSVGSTSFTFGSVLIFFFVIWIANFFQKYIGYFFGDTGNDDVVHEKKSKLGTSILLIRLLILTAGFFLGILASGIPLDKVTIIIGALGVGIGLGLQNIVNNLVSGVILAIERPIQVGDIIEVGSNTGRVKDIGIRSSRIVTPDGAEVIIPNGDMLSQKLTNWTLNNTHLRLDATIKLADSANIAAATKIISNILKTHEGVMQNPEPQIVYNNITQSGAELKLLFWAFDINKQVQLKSDVLQEIYLACSKENINLA
jgi:potassium-dependent mechanosensitive channel